ncbi:MAG: type II secretion system protein [Candidatus Paceibacterota bacterium]
MKRFNIKNGFTLIELLVTIAIIGILSSILYANFESAREQSRDKVRMTSLKELQLAVELYKSQNGQYPAQGCGTAGSFAGPGLAGGSGFASCSTYITGLTPDFISELPTDPNQENETDKGFYYSSDGNSYKIMVYDSVETLTVDNYGDEFARCPKSGGSDCPATAPANTYAVYSSGAEQW